MAQKINDSQMGEQNIMASSARSTTQSHVVIGSLQIIWAAGQFSSTGTRVNFVKAFDGSPNVFVTLDDVNDHGGRVFSVDSTGFTGEQNYTTSNLWLHWMAIGKAKQ